jgi:LysW-gamma-L-lysine carboxypeptidase
VAEENVGANGLFDRLQVSLLNVSSGCDGLEDACVAELAFRLPPRFSAEAVRSRLAHLLPGLQLQFTEGIDAHRADADTELARAFRVAVRAEGGRPAPVLKTGTSDMNVVAPRWNVPTVAYGPGDSNLDHTPEERLELAEYLRSVNVLVGVLTTLAAAYSSPG